MYHSLFSLSMTRAGSKLYFFATNMANLKPGADGQSIWYATFMNKDYE